MMVTRSHPHHLNLDRRARKVPLEAKTEPTASQHNRQRKGASLQVPEAAILCVFQCLAVVPSGQIHVLKFCSSGGF